MLGSGKVVIVRQTDVVLLEHGIQFIWQLHSAGLVVQGSAQIIAREHPRFGVYKCHIPLMADVSLLLEFDFRQFELCLFELILD